MFDWLKHAFAVDPPGPAEPTPRQAEVVDRVCREVVRRRLTTPALITLEMCRPLNFVMSQVVLFFDPIVKSVTGADGPRDFATFLEHRGSIDYLAGRIESLEAEAVRRESASRPMKRSETIAEDVAETRMDTNEVDDSPPDSPGPNR